MAYPINQTVKELFASENRQLAKLTIVDTWVDWENRPSPQTIAKAVNQPIHCELYVEPVQNSGSQTPSNRKAITSGFTSMSNTFTLGFASGGSSKTSSAVVQNVTSDVFGGCYLSSTENVYWTYRKYTISSVSYALPVTTTSGNTVFLTDVSADYYHPDINGVPNIWCDGLIPRAEADIMGQGLQGITLTGSLHQVVICIPDVGNDVTTVNAYLANNPIEVVVGTTNSLDVDTPLDNVPYVGLNTISYNVSKSVFSIPVGTVIDESRIMQGSLTVDRSCSSGNSLELGACIASEMSVTILNDDGLITGETFKKGELILEVGVVDDNDNEYYIPMGKFVVDKVPKIRDLITITAYDRMVWLDKVANNLVKWWGSGTKTVLQIIKNCVSKCNINMAVDDVELATYPNAGYTVSLPKTFKDGTAITYRQLLSYAVALMGKCAWMNANGYMEIGFAEALNTNSSAIAGIAIVGNAIVGNSSGGGTIQNRLDDTNRYSSGYEDYTVTITGVTCTRTLKDSDGEEYDYEYVNGTNEYAFDLSDNPLVKKNPTTALNNLSGLIGIEYTPMDATVVPCPYIFPMDWVSYEKPDGSTIYSIVTGYTYLMNGNNGIKSVGESPNDKDYSTTWYSSQLAEQASDFNEAIADVQTEIDGLAVLKEVKTISGNASATITIPDSYRGIIYAFRGASTMGQYMINCSSAGSVSICAIATVTNLTLTTGTNSLTIANSSSGGAYIYAIGNGTLS